MRSRVNISLLSLLVLGCDPGGGMETGYGSAGGSGDLVEFSFACDSSDVACPGAEKSEGLICGRNVSTCVQEIRCAWSCALNATEYKDYRHEDLTEPARHVVTFRKGADSCWRIHSINTDKCGKFIEESPRWDQGGNWP
jgi:hypothetical protein